MKTTIFDKTPEEFYDQFGQYQGSAYQRPLLRFVNYLWWASRVRISLADCPGWTILKYEDKYLQCANWLILMAIIWTSFYVLAALRQPILVNQ